MLNSNGVVTAITINNPGAGYTSAPTITLSGHRERHNGHGNGSADGYHMGSITVPTAAAATGMRSCQRSRFRAAASSPPATAIAVVSGGVVTGITITNPGSGYTSAPTVAISNNFTVLENTSGPQTVNLTGITAGGNEIQSLNVFATSSNTALIPNPTVTYTSPGTTGTLNYLVLPNQSGTATITVTVVDNGGTANGGVNTASQIFTVTVNPVNQAPTINPIANPNPIPESTRTPQTVNLTGITAGPGESENLTITAVSSNPGLIANPATTATATATLSGGTVGTIAITGGGNAYAFPPNVTIAGGGGSGAAATAAVNSSGVVTGITITNAGSGYTSAPTVTIDPPLATAVDGATFSGGTVTALTPARGGPFDLRQQWRRRLLEHESAEGRHRAAGQWHPGDGDRRREQ